MSRRYRQPYPSLARARLSNAVAKEVAWRKARRGWRFEVGHLPKEANLLADALSRQAAACPDPIAFPAQALASAKRVDCPNLKNLWKVI